MRWVGTPAGKTRCGFHPQRLPPGGNRVVWSGSGNRSQPVIYAAQGESVKLGPREEHPVNQTGVLTGERENSMEFGLAFERKRHGSPRSPSVSLETQIWLPERDIARNGNWGARPESL
jgi:hypothetical protein